MSAFKYLLRFSAIIALISILMVTNDTVFIIFNDAVWFLLNILDNSHSELSHNLVWNSEIYKPTETENTYYNLKLIKGEIPSDCSGVLLFIGANPRFLSPGIKQHWFDGDGMINSIQLIANNQSAHYSNAWMKTPKFEKESQHKRSLYIFGIGSMQNNGWIGFIKAVFAEFYVNYSPFSPIGIPNRYGFGPANTAIIEWKNKLYALSENSMPFEFKYDYQTSSILSVGYDNFNNSWNYAFSAHPKIDKINNILYTFGYGINLKNEIIIGMNDYLSVKMKKSVIIKTDQFCMMHDMMITENYIIMFVTNMVLGSDAFLNSNYKKMIYFDESIQGKIGILRKNEIENGNITWFNVNNYMIFHTANGYEENNQIIIISAWMDYFDLDMLQNANSNDWTLDDIKRINVNLQQYTINIDRYSVEEKILLNNVNIEMPFVDPMYLGKKTKYVYFSLTDWAKRDNLYIIHWKGFAKYDLFENIIVNKIIYDDLDDNTIKNRNWGMPQIIFIPKNNENNNNNINDEEDDGYLANMIYSDNTKTTTLRIWDTKQIIINKEIVVIEIPKRVPITFHGTFVSNL